jgi:hypothetical protein
LAFFTSNVRATLGINIHSNSVNTNYLEPWKAVRYSHVIVITLKIYIVN